MEKNRQEEIFTLLKQEEKRLRNEISHVNSRLQELEQDREILTHRRKFCNYELTEIDKIREHLMNMEPE